MGISDKERIIRSDSEWSEIHPLIVRRNFDIETDVTPRMRMFLWKAASSIDPSTAKDISDKLSHNAYMGFNRLGPNRPQSAFYILDENQLSIDLCLSTWEGKIHHNIMREQNPQYESFRLDDPKILRSGHFGRLKLPSFGEISVAMIESIGVRQGRFLLPNLPEYAIVATLAKNRIVPVNAAGFPVQIVPVGMQNFDRESTELYEHQSHGVIFDSSFDSRRDSS